MHRLVWILALTLLLPACSRSTSDGGPAGNVQQEAWRAVRNGALLVDVRSQEEFDAGHLDGALLIPHDEIAARASELGADKDRTIVLYCRTGNRSGRAKRSLEALGYTHVLNAGGFESMRRAQ